MNIYKEKDYTKVLSETIAERKKVDTQVNFQNMSHHARIPKSYLSRVIHGKANLNEDQMELVCGFLNLDDDETHYMQLLLAYEKSCLEHRKKKIERKITSIRNSQLKTEKHITARQPDVSQNSIDDYYLDPMIQIVHISLTIPRFQKRPRLLCDALNISSTRLEKSLSLLEKMAIIERSSAGVQILMDDIHLSKDSKLYESWRSQLKLMTMSQLQTVPTDKTYSFSVLFSADETARVDIQNAFLEYLNKVRKIVEEAPRKKTYQMSFDLLPWVL